MNNETNSDESIANATLYATVNAPPSNIDAPRTTFGYGDNPEQIISDESGVNISLSTTQAQRATLESIATRSETRESDERSTTEYGITPSASQVELSNTEVVSYSFGRRRSDGEIGFFMKDFIGHFVKISGTEGHHLDIKLTEQANIKVIFLKLSIEPEGHIAAFDYRNHYKFHIQHSYGMATFTTDLPHKYLIEENHTDGKNWIWKYDSNFSNSSSGVSLALNL